MAVRIKFDGTHNPIQPTIVLATRRGKKIGKIPASNIVFKDSMNNGYEMSFKVYRSGCGELWNRITDFKLVWVRDWDRWFEIDVDVDDTGSIVKNITATSLGIAELSQINLYNREINTEDDISRDDYVPTVFYNPSNPDASLLNRLLDKAPHYCIGHVDTSLMNIQRTFSFNDKSIYDAMQEVATEIECLITADCTTDADGKILRQVNAYDLKSHCLECGTRGDFVDTCTNCGSSELSHGYGEDTSIFVSTENLADNIKFSTDNGSVKNCFKLEAGDDLTTAAIVSCNPNGSGYIWHISDETKEDMSDELVQKLNDYDELYAYYQKEHEVSIPDELLNEYNLLIEKYSVFTSDFKKVSKNVVGYPALMERYFDTIDFEIFLTSKLMPDAEMIETTAAEQVYNISQALLSGVSVKNIDICSASTAESAVLGIAKAVADSRYQIRISDSTYSDNIWSGIIQAINESNEDDTATSDRLSCQVNDDYEGYVKQKILKTIKRSTEDATGVDAMFKLSEDDFREEMKKYCLSRLSAFHDICQTCIDILIEHGIADKSKWTAQNDDLYNSIYLPYYNKLRYLEEEINVREHEIAVVAGTYDSAGRLESVGMKTFLQAEKDTVQENLNFDKYLGEECLLEFSAYRREDTYRNNNYISDGLNNAELFQLAQSFIEVARADIFKSSTLQHKITAKLKNILGMKEFEIIVDYFEIGNWIRVRIDDKLCKLRLIEYEIDFDNFDDIDVEFSDVIMSGDTLDDVESIVDQASTMATSYDTVTRQAKQGEKSNAQLVDWVERGLELTKMRIVDSADNQNISWDSHGLLCKEYLPILGSYDDKQLKIINRGLYLTDDNWRTSKAGIGDFTYWNPKTGKMEESYGVIADVIVGNIVLSEEVGIYNQDNSITLDRNGFTLTSDYTGEVPNRNVFTIQKKLLDEDGNEYFTKQLYIDDEGNLVLNGSISVFTGSGSTSLEDLANADGENQYLHIKFSNDGKTFTGNILSGVTADSFEDGGYDAVADMPEYVDNKICLSELLEIDPSSEYLFDTHYDGTYFEIFLHKASGAYAGVQLTIQNGEVYKLGDYGSDIANITVVIVSDKEINTESYGTYVANGLIPEITIVDTMGEEAGIYIGTLLDSNEEASTIFSDYTWKQFTEDVAEEIAELQNSLQSNVDSLSSTIKDTSDKIYETIKSESDDINSTIDSKIGDIINSYVPEQINSLSSTIDQKYGSIMDDVANQLTAHKAEVGQYMTFNEDGLTLGASSSQFKSVIDNTGLYFKQGNTIVSYVNNNQLYIPNAVIESTLILGNFFFCPREDGGVSLTWQE